MSDKSLMDMVFDAPEKARKKRERQELAEALRKFREEISRHLIEERKKEKSS